MARCVLLVAPAALFTVLSLSAPALAGSACRPDEDCWRGDRPARYDDDWYLHRPSSPAERAETDRLNRDYRYVSEEEDIGPPPAPPREFYDRGVYDRESADYRNARARYDSEMVHYRQALADYDAKRADYERARAVYQNRQAYRAYPYRY